MSELAESECWTALRSTDIGRIAVSTADRPVDIFPINFVVDHGSIVFRTAEGTKLTATDVAGEIAFEADGFDDLQTDDDQQTDDRQTTVWSVVAYGHAERLHRRQDIVDAFGLEVHPLIASDKPFFVRLVPDSISGRRFPLVIAAP